ncbi:hypothetical protein ADUPG1_009592 [Aduncisulcus paluster]|uniref:Uncharacterized protein n=1 Tax=Aduncisulcus paluster TaxID=2918883 RepID=A0ABQ5KW58_9EUKA|nr:hypothetical protein ADUPG1_009592 [Aduncisulcus paluster]
MAKHTTTPKRVPKKGNISRKDVAKKVNKKKGKGGKNWKSIAGIVVLFLIIVGSSIIGLRQSISHSKSVQSDIALRSAWAKLSDEEREETLRMIAENRGEEYHGREEETIEDGWDTVMRGLQYESDHDIAPQEGFEIDEDNFFEVPTMDE